MTFRTPPIIPSLPFFGGDIVSPKPNAVEGHAIGRLHWSQDASGRYWDTIVRELIGPEEHNFSVVRDLLELPESLGASASLAPLTLGFPCTLRRLPLQGEPVRLSFQGPQRGSRAEFVCGFKDVYTRQGIRGYLVNIRLPKWKGAMWLGTFNTAREAAYVRDAMAFYSGEDFKYNFPELEGTFPPLPSHLRVDSVEDLDEIVKFVQKQGREAACRTKDDGKRGVNSNLSAAVDQIEEIQNGSKTKIVDTRTAAEPAATAANKFGKCAIQDFATKSFSSDAQLDDLEINLAEKWVQWPPEKGSYDELGRTQADMYPIVDPVIEKTLDQRSRSSWLAPDAKMEESDYLIQAVKADVTEGGSMCRSLEEPDGHEGSEWLYETESADEECRIGTIGNISNTDGDSSTTHESEAEATGDSPCPETNSNYPGRKRKSINEGDLIGALGPFIKKHIGEAFNSTLLPLVSALRIREENEQKHREQLLALEVQKLALQREKLLFKRRRVALSPGLRRILVRTRSGYSKVHGLRATSPAL